MTQGTSSSSLDRGQALHLAEALAASNSEFERMAHARALANLGSAAAAAAAPRLAQMLTAREPGSAAAAAFVLCEIGPAALAYCPQLPDNLAAQLGHWDGEVRHWAAAALGRVAPDSSQAAPQLRALLKDPDEGVCLAAIYALEAMDAAAGECLESLAHLLRSGRPGIRRAAARALATAAKSNRAAVAPLLAHALDGPDCAAGMAAAAALILMEDSEWDMAAHAALEEAIENRNAARRREAIEAVSLLSNPSENVMVMLGKRLGAEPDAELRAEAAHLIRRWAAHTGPVSAALLSALRDSDDRVRQTVAHSLSASPHIKGDAGVASVLAERFDDPDVQVRGAILAAYVHAEPEPERAAAALREALQSPEPAVRLAAVEAFAARPGLPQSRAALEACLRGDGTEIRIAAARALVKAGAPEAGFPTLHEALTDNDLAAQAKAVQAIGDADALPEELRAALADLRDHGPATLRESAATILARIDTAP